MIDMLSMKSWNVVPLDIGRSLRLFSPPLPRAVRGFAVPSSRPATATLYGRAVALGDRSRVDDSELLEVPLQ